jgi:predicted esterase
MRLTLGPLLVALPLLSQIVACGSVETATSSSPSGPITGSGGAASASSGSGGAGGVASTSTSASVTVGVGGGAASSSASSASSSSASSSSSTSGSSSGSGGPPPPPLCALNLSAGHHVFACDGGISYDVEIPAACTSPGCGLVVDIHGFTMNADLENKGSQMQALGKKNSYIVVQPSAPGLPASWDQATHAPLVYDFVAGLASVLGADPKRIHVMGFSQGGGMTWRLLCDHAAFFASASPLGGLAGCEFSGANAPSQEIPILQVHGRKDAVVSFPNIAIPQRDAALAYWMDGPGVVLEDDGIHKATRYVTAAGTRFELWEHDYLAGSFILGGHCFPGGTDVGASPFQYGCTAPGTFIYGELAMQFFLDHPKP